MPLEVLAVHSNCSYTIVSDRLEVISQSEAVVERSRNADRLVYSPLHISMIQAPMGIE